MIIIIIIREYNDCSVTVVQIQFILESLHNSKEQSQPNINQSIPLQVHETLEGTQDSSHISQLHMQPQKRTGVETTRTAVFHAVASLRQ